MNIEIFKRICTIFIMIIMQIISSPISLAFYIVIFIPIGLFLFYYLTNLLNKFYIKYLVGKGTKWYQRRFIFPASIIGWAFGVLYIDSHLQNGELQNYIAIVRANNYFPESILPIFAPSEKKLVQYLYDSNKNYKVYNKVTSSELKKIIMDKNISSLLIFGHGDKHGIQVGKDEMLFYCDLPKNVPYRHLFAQFHCNHFKGKGLTEYGAKAKYILVKEKAQNDGDIEEQVDRIIREKLL